MYRIPSISEGVLGVTFTIYRLGLTGGGETFGNYVVIRMKGVYMNKCWEYLSFGVEGTLRGSISVYLGNIYHERKV